MATDFNKTTSTLISQVTGVGLFASTSVSPGDSIIRISKPYIAIPSHTVLSTHCYYCLVSQLKLFKCTGCKTVAYCGAICQKLSWSSGHGKECKIFKKVAEEGRGVLPTSVRALIQVLHLLRDSSGKDAEWQSLMDHRAELLEDPKNAAIRDEVVLQARGALHYANLPSSLLSIATSILCRMKVNGFRITLPDDTPVGMCFEPVLSRANHSCTPNAFISFDGRKVTLKALHSLKAGAEILITYIDPTQPLNLRQTELQQHYFFKCKCMHCTLDMDTYTAYTQNDARASNFSSIATTADLILEKAQISIPETTRHINNLTASDYYAIENAKNVSDPKERLDSLITVLDKIIFPQSSLSAIALHPLPSLLHEIYLTHLLTSSYATATTLRIFLILNSDPFLYPERWHPVRITSLYALYKLLKIIYQDPTDHGLETLKLLPTEVLQKWNELGWKILYVILRAVVQDAPRSHGDDSRFMAEVRGELEELEAIVGDDGIGATEYMEVTEVLKAVGESKIALEAIRVIDIKGLGIKRLQGGGGRET